MPSPGAAFNGDTDFGFVTFPVAMFDRATFTGEARFDWVTFTDEAWFNGATFSSGVRFGLAVFKGNADFYYGEMEMRRVRPLNGSSPGDQSGAASPGRVERGILTAYWLVSGYGLRAWRAAVALAVVTALFAIAFHLVGFAVPPRPVSY